MRKNIITILFILLLMDCFSQSKNEQIMILNNRIDSIINSSRKLHLEIDSLINLINGQSKQLKDCSRDLSMCHFDFEHLQQLRISDSIGCFTEKETLLQKYAALRDSFKQLYGSSNSYFDSYSQKQYVIKVGGREVIVADNDFSMVMNWNEAVQACKNLGNGWRLPSNDELIAIYEQLYLKSKGNFYQNIDRGDSEYWSAIENRPGDLYEAYFFCFANGILQNTADANGRDKTEKYNVRAVRTK